MKPVIQASALAVECSTTSLNVSVRSKDGQEDAVSLDGAPFFKYLGQDEGGVDPDAYFDILLQALSILHGRGWRFGAHTSVCIVCHQHCLVVCNKATHVSCASALTWKCNFAVEEVRELWRCESRVGKLAPRLGLPKALKYFKEVPELKDKRNWVMLLPDYLAFRLTSKATLCTSEGASNGFIGIHGQDNHVDCEPLEGMLPTIVQSGTVVGEVVETRGDNTLQKLKKMLDGAQVVAGLGDNPGFMVQAYKRDKVVYLSYGTSGTANRNIPRDVFSVLATTDSMVFPQLGNDQFILTMLPDCMGRFDKYVKGYGRGKSPAEISSLVENDRSVITTAHVPANLFDKDGDPKLLADFLKLSELDRVKAVLSSIVNDMLPHAFLAIEALPETAHTVVLVGGGARSRLVQSLTQTRLRTKYPRIKVCVSGRKLAQGAEEKPKHSAPAFGALLVAMCAGNLNRLPAILEAEIELTPVE